MRRAPFALSAVETGGVRGRTYVDGKRVLRLRLPILPLRPPLVVQPLAPKVL